MLPLNIHNSILEYFIL